MDWIRCCGCQLHHARRADGRCPRCGTPYRGEAPSSAPMAPAAAPGIARRWRWLLWIAATVAASAGAATALNRARPPPASGAASGPVHGPTSARRLAAAPGGRLEPGSAPVPGAAPRRAPAPGKVSSPEPPGGAPALRPDPLEPARQMLRGAPGYRPPTTPAEAAMEECEVRALSEMMPGVTGPPPPRPLLPTETVVGPDSAYELDVPKGLWRRVETDPALTWHRADLVLVRSGTPITLAVSHVEAPEGAPPPAIDDELLAVQFALKRRWPPQFWAGSDKDLPRTHTVRKGRAGTASFSWREPDGPREASAIVVVDGREALTAVVMGRELNPTMQVVHDLDDLLWSLRLRPPEVRSRTARAEEPFHPSDAAPAYVPIDEPNLPCSDRQLPPDRYAPGQGQFSLQNVGSFNGRSFTVDVAVARWNVGVPEKVDLDSIRSTVELVLGSLGLEPRDRGADHHIRVRLSVSGEPRDNPFHAWIDVRVDLFDAAGKLVWCGRQVYWDELRLLSHDTMGTKAQPYRHWGDVATLLISFKPKVRAPVQWGFIEEESLLDRWRREAPRREHPR